MSTTYAYAATDSQSPLAPFEFQRRALRDLDVQIDVLLRRLPLRPSPGAQRMAQHDLPGRAGP